MWCQNTASDVDVIRCTDKIVWLSELHLMSMSSNALTIENDVSTAASDAETIRCTDDWMWCQNVAFNLIAIRWKTVDVRIAAFDRDGIKCTDDCLIVRQLHLMSMSLDARWRLFRCQKNCTRPRTIKCTDEVVCWCQMTALDPERSDALAKLFVDVKWLHSIPNDQMH